MIHRKLYPFSHEKILRLGLYTLLSASLLAAGALIFLHSGSPPWMSLASKPMTSSPSTPLCFSLSQGDPCFAMPLPSVEQEISFSFDPPRPDALSPHLPLFVRLKKSAQSTRVSLPSRIDLRYEEQLRLSPSTSGFWMELSPFGPTRIEAKVYIATPSEERIEAESFVALVEDSPLQTANEFPENSPFRLLAEAKGLGHDLFREKFGGGAFSEKIEIGPQEASYGIHLTEGGWIGWMDGKWQPLKTLAEGKGSPIARVASREGRSLILEGWDHEGHVRLCLKKEMPSDFKVKPEELFHSVRIRSEKQISCMLEKQCLILRTGDWVFKGDKRWKVLRKPDEKSAYLNGKMVGELFVFDRIETKAGQKVVQGLLFNVARLSSVPIEINVQGPKSSPSKTGGRKSV